MRALMLVGSLLAGVWFGVAGAFLQAVRFMVAGITIPAGMILMLALLLVLLRALVEITDTRWAAWLAFGGWLATTVLFAAEMPSGSLVISAGDRQMGYLVGGVILGAAAATIPPMSRLRRASVGRVEEQ